MNTDTDDADGKLRGDNFTQVELYGMHDSGEFSSRLLIIDDEVDGVVKLKLIKVFR